MFSCLADISYKRRNIYLEDAPKIPYEKTLVFCMQKQKNKNKKTTPQELALYIKQPKTVYNLPLPPYTRIKTNSKPRRTSYQSKDNFKPKLKYIFDSEHVRYRGC